jgi:hypothetical protein
MMGGGTIGGGGMMGGESGHDGGMGQYGGSPSWTPPSGSATTPLTVAGAQRIADQWLGAHRAGETAGEPDALPGYLTFHTLRDGKITGMLSVNERTGAVWYHWWHGRFVAMEE